MHKINYKLLFVVLILIVFGLLMVYSASNVVAMYRFNDKAYFLKRILLNRNLKEICYIKFLLCKKNIEKYKNCLTINRKNGINIKYLI